MAGVALVTALLPPSVGGTEILVWRLFRGDPELVVISGAPTPPAAGTGDDLYRPLQAPTLSLPYPRLRGYRYGLAPLLGAAAIAWLARSVVRAVRFLRTSGVDRVVSIPHQGPFALVGYLAARRLGLRHTFYILDAWEEGSTGPIERRLIRAGLRHAARAPQSRVAVVSPALGEHYRRLFGFASPLWIPNPAPLPDERSVEGAGAQPFALFTGGVKPFNLDVLLAVAQAMSRCQIARRFVVTGNGAELLAAMRARGLPTDQVDVQGGGRADIARLQREAAVLLVATNPDDRSETARGYLPGRLPEYVASGRPILVVGRQDAEAARAVRHWRVGQTTASTDRVTLARLLDQLTEQGLAADVGQAGQRQLFLEVFSRTEARRRLLDEPGPAIRPAAAALAASFEAPEAR